MPSQQAMLNIAAYAALSLAGVGSCLLPDHLPATKLAGPEYVEVPMAEPERAAPVEDDDSIRTVAWSDTAAIPGGGKQDEHGSTSASSESIAR